MAAFNLEFFLLTAVRLLLAAFGLFLTADSLAADKSLDKQAVEPVVFYVYYGIAALLVLGGIFLPLIIKGFQSFMILRVAVLLVCAVLLYVAVITTLVVIAPLFKPRANGSEAFLLVLGAPVVNDQPGELLITRADGAVLWSEEHAQMPIVITGGKGGTRTEAEHAKELMAVKGVDADRILLEIEATTTYENLDYIKGIVSGFCDTATDSVAVLTNSFHIFRTDIYLKKQGYGNIQYVSVETPFAQEPIWVMREVIILTRYWLTGR